MDNKFDRLNKRINALESSIVNLVTATAPWLAPLAPASMTYYHMRDFLNFEPWLSFALALLVEVLGFGTVSTALQFWAHNRKNVAKYKKAPMGVIIFTFSFYLILILLTNVVIDIANAFGSENQLQWALITVRALLTLQTIPGALIVAVRTSHRELIKSVRRSQSQAGSQTQDPKDSETFRKLPKDWRALRPTLNETDIRNLADLTPESVRELSLRHEVTTRTVENWRAYAIQELKGVNDDRR